MAEMSHRYSKESTGAQPVDVPRTSSVLRSVRLCACGCRREFEPRRKNHRYFEQACRERAMRTKTVPIRVTASEAAEIRSRMVSRNAQKSVVQQIPWVETGWVMV